MLSCIVFFKQNGCSKQNAGEKETTIYLSAITVRFSEIKNIHIFKRCYCQNDVCDV